MNRVIIDCQTNQTIIEELTPEEEAKRLEEIVGRVRQDKARRREQLKRQLAGELAELREMQQQRQIFDDGDISEKQAQVDALKIELQELKKSI